MTPSTDPNRKIPTNLDADVKFGVDEFDMPVSMYEFLTGAPLPEVLPPGFSVHEDEDAGISFVHWRGSFHAPETDEEDA